MENKKCGIILTLLLIFGLSGVNKAYSQAVVDRVPISFFTFVPCANDGAGEFVVADDVLLQFVSNITVDANGGLHIKSHAQPHQYWDFVGQDSGDNYQATGLTGSTTNFNSNGESFNDTFYNNFRVIGPGSGNNYLLHVNSHVTINANGDVTVNAVNTSVSCK